MNTGQSLDQSLKAKCSGRSAVQFNCSLMCRTAGVVFDLQADNIKLVSPEMMTENVTVQKKCFVGRYNIADKMTIT